MSFVVDANEVCNVTASLGMPTTGARCETFGESTAGRQENCIEVPAALTQRCALTMPLPLGSAVAGGRIALQITLRPVLEAPEAPFESTQITARLVSDADGLDLECVCLIELAQQELHFENSSHRQLLDVYGFSLSDEVCVVCMGEVRRVVALPCRHCCTCARCANELSRPGSRCPLCRQPVLKLLELRLGG
mmetsp:Transcript_71830/g.115983  ORF Transcript_71830/g.115983 Transcript_71830/m.115983 type:complete len:192 (+) Transcript_71830:1-576(+)